MHRLYLAWLDSNDCSTSRACLSKYDEVEDENNMGTYVHYSWIEQS